jgi:hypothetical protein
MAAPARRLIVILSLAAILFAALTPGVSSQLLAILPLPWFFFAVLVSITLRTIAGPPDPPAFLFRPVLASRPPPLG